MIVEEQMIPKTFIIVKYFKFDVLFDSFLPAGCENHALYEYDFKPL